MNFRLYIYPRLLPVFFTVLASACAVGPDFHKPELPPGHGYAPAALPGKTVAADTAGGEAQRFNPGMDIPGQWWELFKSPELNTLIKHSLEANPDLQAAESALRVARENVLAEQGVFLPSIDAGFTRQRQRIANSTAASTPLPSGLLTYNLNTAQVTVGYAPDVFGLNRRTVEALQAQADAQQFQLEAAYLTLTSNLVAAAVQEASLRAQIDATRELLAINAHMLDTVKKQLKQGYAARLDVAAQEAQLAQIRSTLPPLQKQLAQQRNVLAVLSGHTPAELPESIFELSALQLPRDLPVSLPSKLVEQRPDVRAAEAQLHAASAQIGVATANMLPQFTISANGGDVGTAIKSLFNSYDRFWSLSYGVTQPIFQGGMLLHKKRGAEAAYAQAAAQYRSTVNSAFQNVGDTLNALHYDADGLATALEAERAARVTLDLTQRQLEAGYINAITAFTARQAYQQTVISLAQARASRFADTAALFQALGGGWWNRNDITADLPNDTVKS